ncbi:MAG: pyruvate kinase [Candidatus Bathyarchaeota archaeon]|nr:pyruvate kinase [Candidatus Bathyarchaeota archaeon]
MGAEDKNPAPPTRDEETMDGYARSKIICTIGPASRRPDILREMAAGGMDVARINMSHGSLDEHRNTIRAIRSLGSVAVLLDLPGPKIRLGELKEPVMLREGDAVRFTTENVVGEGLTLPVNYDRLPAEVRPGGRVFINDGLIELTVLKVDGDLRGFDAKVVSGGEASTHKGVNAPGASLSLRPPTEQDVKGIEFGVQAGVDWFAASFIRSRKDIEAVKEAVETADGDQPVISKIEHGEAITNIDEIISASDGVMVARGDLGIEVPPWEVPLLQKRIISKCNEAGKPVIVATQMLESMVKNPRPTRAEASDVANAILDGADAIMLSEETATGAHPVEAVRVMESVSRVVEVGTNLRRVQTPREGQPIADIIGSLAATATEVIKPSAIIVPTRTGFTSLMVSKYRPPTRILAVSKEQKVARRIRLYWGVEPIDVQWSDDRDELIIRAVNRALRDGYIRDSDSIMVVSGSTLEAPGRTSTLEILKVHEILAHAGGRDK